MLMSMTAYGRAAVATPVGRFVAEIQSVNKRHLDITPSLPRELARFDPAIRRWIAAALCRGQVQVRISAEFIGGAPVVVSPNIPLAKQLKAASETLAKELGLTDDLSLETLFTTEGVLTTTESPDNEEAYHDAIKSALEAALKPFIAMREAEGRALQADIAQRIVILRKAIDQVKTYASSAAEGLQKRLSDRIEALLPGAIENEERILREVCVYAEKVDVTEEITRFCSHLDQIDTLLTTEKRGVGKTLEFLVQELLREATTMGAKASMVEISRLVIEIKAELERVREQIQNVE